MFDACFEFILSEEITFQSPVGEEKTKTLLLKAPCAKHEKFITKLQQWFTRASIEAGNSANNKAKSKQETDVTDMPKLKGKDVVMIFQASSIDYYEVKQLFYSLLINDIAFIGNDIKITKHLLDKISLLDRDRLLGEYFENFILPSWTDQSEQI